jgi:putative tryptophan/tyrosine transport system substrate-binding protein
VRRRDFITLAGGAAAAWPLAARAQQPAMPVIGFLHGASPVAYARMLVNMDRIRATAASLLASNPDVVVTIGGRVVPIPILMQLSRSVPIVLPGTVDPVGTGWVESLARPGGNVTGFTALELPMFGKILETLKQLAPATTRVGLIYNPDNPTSAVFRHTIGTFAGQLAVEPVDLPIHQLADIERALASLADRPNASVYFLPDLTVNALRAEVVALVERRRLPAMYSEAMFVKSGGLAFYGVDRIDLYRRAAGYVDRILRGEKPAGLPFQQPTKYQLVINLNAARTLGLTVPPSLLVAADEVIE